MLPKSSPLLLLLAIVPFIVSVAGFASHGDDCTKDSDCIAEQHLYCNSFKTCSCPEYLKYDEIAKTCVIPTTGSCHLIAEEGEPLCTTGSTCVKHDGVTDPTKGACMCDPGQQEHLQAKKCVPRILPGGKCESSAGVGEFLHECLEFADCTSGVCSCQSGLIFDRYTQQCVIGIGDSCPGSPTPTNPVCSSNANCDVTCKCKEGFSLVPNEKRCLKTNVPIGDYCELNVPAAVHSCTGLSTCQNGRCDCGVPGADVIEDKETNTCAHAVGSICFTTAEPGEPTCISNSECVTPSWSPDKSKGHCQCTQTYEQFPATRTCTRRIDIGSDCKPKSPTEFIPSCAKYANCAGNEGERKCECWESFNTKPGDNSTCHLESTGLEGARCFLEGENTCTANAICQKSMSPKENEEDVMGTCSCGRGYKPNAEKLCLWSPNPYDGTCEDDIECSHDLSMKCSAGGRCRCSNEANMIFDQRQQRCLVLVGEGLCSLEPQGDVEDQCVRNAHCLPKANNPSEGTCHCNPEFNVAANKTCVIKGGGLIGEPCLIPEGTCATENSECQKQNAAVVEDDEVGVCQCRRGFKLNSENLCLWSPQPFGGPCEEDIECSHKLSMKCSTQKKCACTDEVNMIHDPRQTRCLVLVGDGLCSLQPEGDVEDQCVRNAHCMKNPNNPAQGNCHCNSQFDLAANKTCTLKGNGLVGDPCYVYDGKCVENADCKVETSVTEDDVLGVCKCKDNYYVDDKNSKCISGSAIVGPILITVTVLQALVMFV